MQGVGREIIRRRKDPRRVLNSRGGDRKTRTHGRKAIKKQEDTAQSGGKGMLPECPPCTGHCALRALCHLILTASLLRERDRLPPLLRAQERRRKVKQLREAEPGSTLDLSYPKPCSPRPPSPPALAPERTAEAVRKLQRAAMDVPLALFRSLASEQKSFLEKKQQKGPARA